MNCRAAEPVNCPRDTRDGDGLTFKRPVASDEVSRCAVGAWGDEMKSRGRRESEDTTPQFLNGQFRKVIFSVTIYEMQLNGFHDIVHNQSTEVFW